MAVSNVRRLLLCVVLGSGPGCAGVDASPEVVADAQDAIASSADAPDPWADAADITDMPPIDAAQDAEPEDTVADPDAPDAETNADTDAETPPDVGGPWRSALYPDDWTPAFTDAAGRFLHDFSWAGYRNGEAEPPASVHALRFEISDFGAVPAENDTRTGLVAAPDATDSIRAAIQAAIAAGGGVVHVPAGTYRLDDTLEIRASGVVLQGAGPAVSRLVFARSQGMSNRAHITFRGAQQLGAHIHLTDDAAPRSHDLVVAAPDDDSAVAVGDDVLVGWEISPAFIAEHNMEGTWRAFNGTWQPFFRRTVTAVEALGDGRWRVRVDVPLRHGAKVRDAASVRVERGLIAESGLEGLGLSNAVAWDAAWDESQVHLVTFEHAKDCWVRGIESFASPLGPESGPGVGAHVQSGGVLVRFAKRITVSDSVIAQAQHRGTGGNGYLFEVRQASEVLFRDVRAHAGRHNFIQNWGFGATGIVWLRTRSTGGRAFPDRSLTFGQTGLSEYHHSLATANLVDSSFADDGWAAVNRRNYSTGAGLTATESVFWNTSGTGVLRSYQFGHGYVIGTGPDIEVSTTVPDIEPDLWPLVEPFANWLGAEPDDWTEGLGGAATLQPRSLYEDQRARRLGR